MADEFSLPLLKLLFSEAEFVLVELLDEFLLLLRGYLLVEDEVVLHVVGRAVDFDEKSLLVLELFQQLEHFLVVAGYVFQKTLSEVVYFPQEVLVDDGLHVVAHQLLELVALVGKCFGQFELASSGLVELEELVSALAHYLLL